MLEFEQLKLRLESNKDEISDLKDAIGYDHLKSKLRSLKRRLPLTDFGTILKNRRK